MEDLSPPDFALINQNISDAAALMASAARKELVHASLRVTVAVEHGNRDFVLEAVTTNAATEVSHQLRIRVCDHISSASGAFS